MPRGIGIGRGGRDAPRGGGDAPSGRDAPRGGGPGGVRGAAMARAAAARAAARAACAVFGSRAELFYRRVFYVLSVVYKKSGGPLNLPEERKTAEHKNHESGRPLNLPEGAEDR